MPPPAERFARAQGALRLLVVGGSLGAARLNAVVPFAHRATAGRCTLARAPPGRRARHRRGARGLRARPASQAEVAPFIDDMAEAYAEADLVICRAGALTISELAAVGVGAILVPFPAAVDDHQTRQCAVPGARGRRAC